MNFFTERWSIRTYTKIIAIFLLVFLSLFFIAAGVLRWSKQELSKNIINTLRAQEESYLERTEQDVQRIYQLLLDMTQDRDLTRLAKAPESWLSYEQTAAVGRICQRLTSIKNSHASIQSVRAYLPNLGWSFHSDGTPEGSYSEITNELLNSIDSIPSNGSAQLAWHQGHLLMPISVRNPWNPQIPFFILVAEFSCDVFLRDYEVFRGGDCAPYQLWLAPDFSCGNFSSNKDSFEIFQKIRESVTDAPEDSVFWKDTEYLYVFIEIPQNGMAVLQLLDRQDVLKPLMPLRFITIAFFIFALLFLMVYCVSAYFLINKPIRGLSSAFQQLEQGNFSTTLPVDGHNDFSSLYRSFNHMVKKLDSLVNEVYEQKLLVQKSELKQLQSQINPHFLYNSYFLLHRLIKGDDLEKATLFSKNMGIYFQFITRSAADIVPLKSEYQHAQIYADIQALRFEKRISVFMDLLPVELENFSVPRLILQPIIENAFEHSLENKQENGQLEIHIRTNSSVITISVEDNGDEMDDQTLAMLKKKLSEYQPGQETTALININRRIMLYFGQLSGLSVDRSILGGLAVTIRMEKRKENNGDVSALISRR